MQTGSGDEGDMGWKVEAQPGMFSMKQPWKGHVELNYLQALGGVGAGV